MRVRMYVPKQFEEHRVEVLHRFIGDHPFGSMVTRTADGLDANHLPFEVDPEPAPFGTLRGHVARANPVWREFDPEVPALVIFRGPDAYVSPSWYPSKAEAGKAVPTWNYAVVHAHGPVRVIEDRQWLRSFLERLTDRHEAGRDVPWAMSDAPEEFIEGLLNAIVGIEIPITRLVGKWKASQNRPAPDRSGVIDGLSAEGGVTNAMAELVRERSEPG